MKESLIAALATFTAAVCCGCTPPDDNPYLSHDTYSSEVSAEPETSAPAGYPQADTDNLPELFANDSFPDSHEAVTEELLSDLTPVSGNRYFETGAFGYTVSGSDLLFCETLDDPSLGKGIALYPEWNTETCVVSVSVSFEGVNAEDVLREWETDISGSRYDEITTDSYEVNGFECYRLDAVDDGSLLVLSLYVDPVSHQAIRVSEVADGAEEIGWCSGIISQIEDSLVCDSTLHKVYDGKYFSLTESDNWFFAGEWDHSNGCHYIDFRTPFGTSAASADDDGIIYYLSFEVDDRNERSNADSEADDIVNRYRSGQLVRNDRIKLKGYYARHIIADMDGYYFEYIYVDLPHALLCIFTNLDYSDREEYRMMREDADNVIKSIVFK